MKPGRLHHVPLVKSSEGKKSHHGQKFRMQNFRLCCDRISFLPAYVHAFNRTMVKSSECGTSVLVVNCIEKLTVLSEVNQVTIIWVRGHSGIQQNKTADRLAREGARTRPFGPEPFLSLSLSRFKSKIRNWIEKKETVSMRSLCKYRTS